MKLQKRIALVAIFVAIGLWALLNRPSSADFTPVSTIKLDGVVEVILMCDQMVRIKDITILEGRQRQDDSILCGASDNAECLPYYMQWRVLLELNSLLDEEISQNCAIH